MPCKLMEKEWEKLIEENDWLQLEPIDSDTNDVLVDKYKIFTVPTSVILDDQGKEVERIEGTKTKNEILAIINKFFNK